MRQLVAVLGLGTMLLAGCNQMKWFRPNPPVEGGLVMTSPNPTAESVVALLNENARRLQSLECHDIDLTCTQGIHSGNLVASMVCQKPRNFRLMGKVVNNTVVDMGSNDHEFWWWISKADPPHLYHCAYDEFKQIQGRVGLPFQPDWIIESLGMAEFAPGKPYKLVSARDNTLELVEDTYSPQGRPVHKVTVLRRGPNQQVYVTAHHLRDEHGKNICSAVVLQSQQERSSNAVLPKKVQIDWPAEKIRLTMTLNDVRVNAALTPERTAVLFTRPRLKDVPSVDLARGMDPPSGAVQRAGGMIQSR
jgi:hypothetical protein